MDLTILALIVSHWFGDFLLQSDWMALNKSKHWDALAVHVAVYTLTFIPALLWIFGNTPIVVHFLAVTALAHFATDAVTSRINARLWQAEQRHWFFVAVGADQVLHYTQLILTLRIP